jgi:hypothetical protein
VKVFGVILAGSALCAAGFAQPAPKQQSMKSGIVGRGQSKPKAAKPGAPTQAAPTSAPQITESSPEMLVPLRPSQLPAVAPRISFDAGLLTIVAPNSTLADIFAGIRSVTGVRIETVGGPSADRVAAKIGPAPLRNVLMSLLQGSKLDYVILGSVQDPEKIERVILSPRMAGGEATAAANQPLRQSAPEPEVEEIESADPAETNFGDENEGFAPAPVPAPGAAPANPNMPPDQQGQPQLQQPGQPQPGQPATPKTPEQLLEDLKRLEQERQQQNQQREQRGERPR